jgi:hypothetical protein
MFSFKFVFIAPFYCLEMKELSFSKIISILNPMLCIHVLSTIYCQVLQLKIYYYVFFILFVMKNLRFHKSVLSSVCFDESIVFIHHGAKNKFLGEVGDKKRNLGK